MSSLVAPWIHAAGAACTLLLLMVIAQALRSPTAAGPQSVGSALRIAACRLGRCIETLLPHAVVRRLRTSLLATGDRDPDAVSAWLARVALHACVLSALAVIVTGRAAVGCLGATAVILAGFGLRRRRAELEHRLVRELPAAIDFIVLAVESGRSLPSALAAAIERLPDGPLADVLGESLAQSRAGRPRSEAFSLAAARLAVPGFTALVAALNQADRTGAGLASLLRAQSEERIEERFARAERLAMESPVKLLLPLVSCIFPCAFIVIGFPIAQRLLQWA